MIKSNIWKEKDRTVSVYILELDKRKMYIQNLEVLFIILWLRS